ncbi:hypothetical protein BX600DRAFT_379622 [Xylariales sp. PMI_506]|nr:hypothetical protein BX600DRAFT_379622 [Xylariales sp. PMI_506]
MPGYGSGNGVSNGGAGYGGDAGEGRERGTRRRKLAAMAGKVYSAGATAVNEIRESYNQTRAGQIDTSEASKITIPGAFPEVAIVHKGNEQMVLFPSYAKRHVRSHASKFQEPAGPPHDSAVGMSEEEYWRQEWARLEDEKAIVDVDVRGWFYNPHKGPMTRRNRILIGLARQLSGIPAPRQQQQELDAYASPHQLHEEEREQMRIAQEARQIEQRGQAEKEAAQKGGYSEAPKDPDSEDEGEGPHHQRSMGSTPSSRSAPGSPSMGVRRTNTAGTSELSEAELAVANANLMARIAPFLTTPLVQVPITVFFYNDTQSQSRTVMTNDSGHFILRAPLEFVPTHLRVLANEDLSATEPVQLIEPHGISLISDIDDTIKKSNITLGAKEIFRNTFIRDLSELTVDGVKEWYTAMHNLGVRIHYCSNSPWQLYPVIATFFKLGGLPPGSIHLKQYSGMLQGIFEPVAERKKGTLEKIMNDFPERRFILVGDSGEADLEVYTDIAVSNPGRIVAIFIRDVTTPEQSGYFDSAGLGGAGAGLGNTRKSSNATSGPSRSNTLDDVSNRPPLPPRLPTDPPRPQGPVMGDLIDFSEDPEPLPSKGSLSLAELSESLPPALPTRPSDVSGKKAPPPRPTKPVSLQSSPAAPVLRSKDTNNGRDQTRVPLPPPYQSGSLGGATAKVQPTHPLAQMQNSSSRTLDSSAAQGVAKTLSSTTPPPPPPPRRRGTPSGLRQLSPRLSPQLGSRNNPRVGELQRRGAPNSDVDSIDALPAPAYPDSGYAAGSPADLPVNKKLELWTRRLARAQEMLERSGVALYTWRRGSDVMEEAVGIVDNAMREMDMRRGGSGGKGDPRNRR